MESLWLTYAKRLQAIASTGLHFSEGPFDRERYREVAEIANEMLARLGEVPIERIAGLVSDFAKGYATPKIDVRGAVIEEGRVLLVCEKSDGLWSLPGGFADVGLSAAENVAKEMREEAGLIVAPRVLYSVRHKAKRSYDPDARDVYKLFFLCDRIGESRERAFHETSDVEFFPPDRLPPLSRGRVIEKDIEAAFAFQNAGVKITRFD